jgi:hypothetical protein
MKRNRGGDALQGAARAAATARRARARARAPRAAQHARSRLFVAPLNVIQVENRPVPLPSLQDVRQPDVVNPDQVRGVGFPENPTPVRGRAVEAVGVHAPDIDLPPKPRQRRDAGEIIKRRLCHGAPRRRRGERIGAPRCANDGDKRHGAHRTERLDGGSGPQRSAVNDRSIRRVLAPMAYLITLAVPPVGLECDALQ